MHNKIDEILEAKLLNILRDKKYYSNVEFINYLSAGFTQKGLSRSIPNQLFMELITLEQLTNIQFIWLLKKLSDYGKEYNVKELLAFNPSDWYSDIQLKEVWEYTNANETIDKIVFHNVDMVDDRGFQYICTFCPVTDIAKFKENNLLSYEFDTQREAKYRAIGTEGTYVKEININQASIDAIANLIYDNKFTANMITLNVPLLGEENEERIVYDEKTRTLEITPDFNIEGGHVTYCNVIDGYHRVCSCVEAVERANKMGKKLRNGFVISINTMTPADAREHFKRENTYNPVSKSFLETFSNSDEAKFVEAMIEFNDKENIFNENVVKTYEECKVSNKLTYNKVLEDGLKQTDINANNSKTLLFTMPKIIEFITLLIEELKNKYKYDSIEKLKKNTMLLDINIFVGYIKVASLCKNDAERYEYIRILSEKLVNEVAEKDLKELGLNNKIYSAKKIADYFAKLI